MIDTLHAVPPAGALRLFSGTDIGNWTGRDGGLARWRVEDEILHVVPGTGDIMTRERLTDFFLHLEFRCPEMPAAQGQAKGNSGVFLQGRYEIQVLDSCGWARPGTGDCGAVYNKFAPLLNACRPAMEWQTYDVWFRAPRPGDAGPRMTVLQNGLTIHNNIQLDGVCGAALDDRIHSPGPLLLQDHGDLVCYRDVWALELPLSGPTQYEPA